MDKVKEDKLVIILGCLVLFCIQILGNMVTLAIPSISQDFHMNVDLTNAVSLIYLVLVISLVLPLAKIISKYGVGKFLKIGISLGIISLIVCAIFFFLRNPKIFFSSLQVEAPEKKILLSSDLIEINLNHNHMEKQEL